MALSDVQKFAGLFVGNGRSHGRWHKKNGRMDTVKSEAVLKDYDSHLRGDVGVGVVPVMDDSLCWFGAIDIDNHKDGVDIDIEAVERKLQQLKAPIVPCRSKSGGVHCYLFCIEPLPAFKVVEYLTKLAKDIGYGGAEIFPKQTQLKTYDGVHQLGNWLNLPYFNAAETERFAVVGGKAVDFDYFLEYAYSIRVSKDVLNELTADEHAGAPPCVVRMLAGEKVNEGNLRNEALYNIGVYLARAFPKDYRARAFDVNARVFDDPLPHEEANKTIKSASRRNYSYKCKEEPCASLCNKAVCLQREFGIGKDEAAKLDGRPTSVFAELIRYTTDPVKWALKIDGVEVLVYTPNLISYSKLREAAAEKLTKILAPMKQAEWESTLAALMLTARVVEAPSEASSSGVIFDRLMAFISRTKYKGTQSKPEDREHLLRGKPVIQDKDGRLVAYFRANDFIDYLKKNRSEELKGPNLWFALKEMGVTHCRLRINLDKVIDVWCVPYDENSNSHTGAKPVQTEQEY